MKLSVKNLLSKFLMVTLMDVLRLMEAFFSDLALNKRKLGQFPVICWFFPIFKREFSCKICFLVLFKRLKQILSGSNLKKRL